MKLSVALIALLAICEAKSTSGGDYPNAEHVMTHWENFKVEHKKEYATQKEHDERLEVFKQNHEMVHTHNALHAQGKVSYELAINHLSDMHEHEMKSVMGFLKDELHHELPVHESLVSAPQSVDWRQRGHVTAVGDQGNCGSCYAFSAAGALEALDKRKNNVLVQLSKQNIVDCSKSLGNLGCNGGSQNYVYKYVRSVGGINSERRYPYRGIEGRCRFNASESNVQVERFVRLRNYHDLLNAVGTVGPVSITLRSGFKEFMAYRSGIFDNRNCNNNIDHALLAVGYGSENGKDYWIVKNSWGDRWGERGYMRLYRNDGFCGILIQSSYPK